MDITTGCKKEMMRFLEQREKGVEGQYAENKIPLMTVPTLSQSHGGHQQNREQFWKQQSTHMVLYSTFLFK